MNKFWTYLRRGMPALAAVALVAIAAEGVSARGADDKAGKQRGTRPASAFNLQATSSYLLSFNEWICGLTANGEVCSSDVGSSVGGGGFWPQGTGNQYIFNSGLQIAGVVGSNGGAWAGDTLGTFFFNASGNGAGVSVGAGIYSSTSPSDLEAWPEDCYLDNPVFGRVKTLSEVDTCVQYWDGDPNAAHFTDSHPMGILVTQHSLQWSFPNNKDILFFSYKFKNVSNTTDFLQRNPQAPAGGYTITDIYAAFAMDPDVSVEYDENYATVVPDLNMGTAWVYDFEADGFTPYAPNFDAAPGFVGVKFLKSPVNTSDESITVNVGSSSRVVGPGEELGLTFFSVFTNGGIMSDAENARQAYRYLSGKLLPSEISSWCPDAPPGMCYVDLQAPDDMRFYQASGPFKLEPGEEAEIVVAYVAGAPVPGTYRKEEVMPLGQVTDTTRQVEKAMGRGYDRPGFPSLFANAEVAQAIYDADFVLPAAPRSPNVTVIPGDRQNTVIWDATPVEATDPFAQLANNPESALYDPNFRASDFEGYRIYRRSNPAGEWELIHQFDLANGISEVVTVQQVVTTISGDELIIQADTARVCRPDDAGCQAETGLQFSIIDRGGTFRSPENGPGLINGVQYFYAVTSFDINSPQSGPNSLESARVLSRNSQGVGAASGTPRSDASGTVAAQVSEPSLFGNSLTDPLDTDVTVTMNPATGTFSGPQPPTNGIGVSFSVFDPLLLSPGPMSVRVDSIIALNGYEDIWGGPPMTSPNALGVSILYYLTVTTPEGTLQTTKEFPAPFGLFGAPAEVSADVANAPLPSDAEKAADLGLDADHFSGSFVASINYGPDYLSSGSEAVSTFRTHSTHEEQGSRWFVGTEPANPADGVVQGQLPGVDEIIGAAHQYGLNANLRWLVYLLSPYMRAVDYEVTWGANGTIDKVFDVTHQIDVPFRPNYRGSWGVRNEVSGDGILTFGDFWLANPVSEWYCETPGCDLALEQTARIQPMSTVPPSGFNVDVAAANSTGFGLYIGGELFLFKTASLPAAGTVWTLRTYSGDVSKDDAGQYVFEPNEHRPPTITGLTAAVSVEAAATVDVAEADLDDAHVVPDPYYVTNILESSQSQKRLQFVNLPPQAVVRIFTLSGVLVAALEHDDVSGGTLEWDLRSRNNQFLASGVYFYHIETPQGREKVGKFTIIQYAQ